MVEMAVRPQQSTQWAPVYFCFSFPLDGSLAWDESWGGQTCRHVLPVNAFHVCVNHVCVNPCVLSCFSCVRLCETLWTIVCRLLSPWNSPGKNTGVGSHALLQGIFLTQGSNPCLSHLLHW